MPYNKRFVNQKIKREKEIQNVTKIVGLEE